MKWKVECGGKDQRHQIYFRKEMNTGSGKENVRKQRGKEKAQNTGGRRDFGARRKVKKINRKWSRRGKVKMNKCTTQRIEGEDTRGRNLGNSGAA
jgi:hypothetical protein